MQADILNEFALFQKNPQQYILSKGLNIPADKLNDPQSAVEYILTSGQGTQDQLNQFKTMLGMFRR